MAAYLLLLSGSRIGVGDAIFPGTDVSWALEGDGRLLPGALISFSSGIAQGGGPN